MEDQTKRVRLMRFWLFGMFVIVFAAVTTYAGMYVGLAIMAERGYWLIIGATAALCLAWFQGYRWWMQRRA